jgi:hypothetical protein
MIFVVCLCLSLFGRAQTPPATTGANDAVLTRAAKLYASSEREGLKGFDCAVHPTWRAMLLDIKNGKLDAADEKKIAALGAVRITLHARLKGDSTLDWAPSGAHATQEYATERQTLEQSLMGFLRFWTPFADGSIVPAAAADMVFAPTSGGGYRLDGGSRETAVTEIFDADLILRSFEVKTARSTILIEPTFSPSPHGLRVSHFLIHIQPAGNAQEQMMQAGVTYGEAGGYTIPIRIDMNVFGAGVINAALDHCQANP